MGKRNDSGWGWLFVGVAALVVIYTQTGREENNATLIPDRLENQIDREVKVLNDRFGKRWVDSLLDVLAFSAQRALPQPLRTVLDVIISVEQMSRDRYMSPIEKQQTAVQMVRRG
jgi:hypothetical protein